MRRVICVLMDGELERAVDANLQGCVDVFCTNVLCINATCM